MHRLTPDTELLQHLPELVLGVEVLRFDADRLSELPDGVFVPAEVPIGDAQLAPFVGILGLDQQARLEDLQGLRQVLTHEDVRTIP